MQSAARDQSALLDYTEFSHFAKEWRIKHTRNSPKYPQKSGEVKREFRTGSEQPAHKKNGLDKILFRP